MTDEATSPRIYYFGVWRAGEAGHHLYTPTGFGDASALPWPSHELDGGLTWNAGTWIVRGSNRWRTPPSSEPVQGHAALHHVEGWTALAWWDFTGDRRGGSNSVVLVDRVRSFEEMRELFAAHFPAQAARQTGLILKHHQQDGAGMRPDRFVLVAVAPALSRGCLEEHRFAAHQVDAGSLHVEPDDDDDAARRVVEATLRVGTTLVVRFQLPGDEFAICGLAEVVSLQLLPIGARIKFIRFLLPEATPAAPSRRDFPFGISRPDQPTNRGDET